MQECRRTEQMCLFIHYPFLDMHTIICVSELVILFLITLESEGNKQCLPNETPRRRGIEYFSYDFYTCTDLSFGIAEEQNKNRVAGPVPES